MNTVIIVPVSRSAPTQTVEANFETSTGKVRVQVESATADTANALLDQVRSRLGYKEVPTNDKPGFAFYFFTPPLAGLFIGFVGWFLTLIVGGMLENAEFIRFDFSDLDRLASRVAIIGGVAGWLIVGVLCVAMALSDYLEKKKV
jgi:hypothetical protein